MEDQHVTKILLLFSNLSALCVCIIQLLMQNAHAEVIQLRCQSTRRNLPGPGSPLLFFRYEFFQPCDWLKWPSC